MNAPRVPAQTEFSTGNAFDDVSLDSVKAFLSSRDLVRAEVAPDSLRALLDGSLLCLEHRNGTVRRHPMRASFAYKVLGWHDVPVTFFHRLDGPAKVELLNLCLGAIRHSAFLHTENGDALTLLSDQYGFYTDMALVAAVEKFGVDSAFRSDFTTVLRLRRPIRRSIQVGDIVEAGMELVNSETGFARVRTAIFLLRLICTNGAVIPLCFHDASGAISHYGASPEVLAAFIERAERAFPDFARRAFDMLSARTSEPVANVEALVRRLRRHLGKDAEGLFQIWNREPPSTAYDIINHITARARTMPMRRRLRLERFAGELIRYGLHEAPERTPEDF